MGLAVAGGTVSFTDAGAAALSSLRVDSGFVDLDRSRFSLSYAAGQKVGDSVRQYLAGGTLYSRSTKSVGYGDGADGVVPGLSAGTVVVKPALAGDVNLDGKVDFSDLLIIAQHYNGAAAAWTKGDFNYDGEVTFSDLLTVAKSYGKTATNTASAVTGIPATSSEFRNG